MTAAAIGLDPAERTRCEIYTRVMGYHRPVGYWNRGKQQEHRDRVQFIETRAEAHCQAPIRAPRTAGIRG